MQELEPFLDLLRCPVTGATLEHNGEGLVAADGARYPLTPSGIPVFAEHPASEEARRQQGHYGGVAEDYLDNLEYPHTQEYNEFIDQLLLDHVGGPVGTLVEVCCGRGEAVRLPGLSFERAVALDIATPMLERGRPDLPPSVCLVQGDATELPLRDGCADAVFMLGGIHHVNDRATLFAEIARVLRPGGRFHWREPVDDFLPWRLMRAVIYRVSPALDAETEEPLRYRTTVRALEDAGLRLERWRTCGFLAWCALMNSDVLVANRLLRFLPGIRALTRLAARLDDLALALPGMGRNGTQVVGVAFKPL
jgi:ubiquinone/menaquinone biosynthesis C-methylase UbiE